MSRSPDAWMKSEGQVESLADSLNTAADRLEESVPLVRRYQDDTSVQRAVDLCTDFLSQILQYFPDIVEAHDIRLTDDDV